MTTLPELQGAIALAAARTPGNVNLLYRIPPCQGWQQWGCPIDRLLASKQ
ncbi:MAG: hypothetical protein F6J93_16955 [Oscillatoria sp. SIO1A7]|nr:hypothetical protein [Oscillatoria sp. SIO1A7]